MIDEDEYLERVVAGINAVANPGAEVKWNQELGGRQFDVVAKFSVGLSRFLVLIEVRNKTRKATAEEIDAFVTKANDQLANKTIFVTKSGYQSGAVEVAKRHGVDLFRVEFVPGDPNDMPQHTSVYLKKAANGSYQAIPKPPGRLPSELAITEGEPIQVNSIEECTLAYVDGSLAKLPDEQTQMQYYAEKTQFLSGRSIYDVMSTISDTSVPMGTRTRRSVPIEPPEMLLPPDEYFFKAGMVKALEFELYGTNATPLSGKVAVDSSAIPPRVRYENIATGEVFETSATGLPVGDAEVRAGRYYFNYYPLRYFYCASVEGEKVTMLLIESFQNGLLIRTKLVHALKYSWLYIPVTDKKILNRLRKRRTDYEKLLR